MKRFFTNQSPVKNLVILLFVLLCALPALAQNYYILEFDGVDDYVRYTDDDTLGIMDGATDYTIEAWVYPDTFETYDRVMQRYYSFNISLWHVAAGGDSADWYFTLYDDGGSAHFFNADTSLARNQWNHIAIICNSTAGTLKLYVNGQDVTRDSYANYPMRASVSFDNLYIGQRGNGSSFFKGFIDEVRLKNVAEDPANLHYNKNDLPYTVDANTAVLLHFDEGPGYHMTKNAAGDSARLGSSTVGDAAEPTWRTWDYNGSDLSLPVELSAFTAIAGDRKATLKWTTRSEINNAGFEIYRTASPSLPYQLISSYTNNPQLTGAGNSTALNHYRYEDRNLINGHTYWYKIADVDFNGERRFHGPVSVVPNSSGTNLTNNGNIPERFALHNNYPNPFNPSTTIRFDVPELHGNQVTVELTVYDIQGHKIKTLLNEPLEAGTYQVTWDGRNEHGDRISSGIYIYSLRTEVFSATKKMMLIR